jgi:cell division protein FtsN
MYCENCQLEIKDQGETQCPLCGNQLRESSAEETIAGNAVGIDFDGMQDAGGAFVLDDDDSGGMDFESPAAQPTPPARGLDMHAAEATAHAQTGTPRGLIDDSSTDMLDQVLEEYDPMVDEHFKVKKVRSKSSTALLLVVLLVCVLGAGGYYYFIMREPAPPEPVAPVKIVRPKKQDAVLDQVLRKEKAPAEAGQQAAADNVTQAVKKPEPPKPAQTAEKKIEEPVIAAPQAPEAKPAEPAAASRTIEKAPYKDKKQPAVAAEKTEEPAPAQPPSAPVLAKEVSRETGKAAGAEQAKKPAAPAPLPAAPAPAEKPASVGAGQPVFTVLTGSFRNQGNAEAEVQRLRTLGYDAHAVKVDLKAKGVWTRVLIGSWTNRAEARQMAEDVRRKTNKKDASVIVME